MNKHRVKRISILTLTVLLVVGVVYYSLQSSEPRFQGKVLSVWLEDLDESKPAEARERAKAVLTQTAKEAAPTFVKTLRAKDSKIKLTMIAWAGKQNILRPNFQTADMRREEAVREFSRFSVGAIPVLTNLFDDPELAFQAVRTLNGIGPQAAVHLVGALGHTNEAVRITAASGLGSIYMNYVQFKNLVSTPSWQGSFPTNETVTALVKCLSDESPSVRATAAFVLGHLGEQAKNVIPALIENPGKTTPPRVRQALAEALGKYGQQAFQAIPALERLLHDSDPAVRKSAEGALKQIEGRGQNDGKQQSN